MKRYILAVDEGTTSVRAVLWDVFESVIVDTATRPLDCHYPKQEWVEQDAEHIFDMSLAVVDEVLLKAGIEANDVCAMGITNQRESVVMFDKDGKTVMPLISWQDRRTTTICSQLKRHNRTVRDKTGLNIDAYFSAAKIKWMLESNPTLRDRLENNELRWGTLDTYLVYRFTHGEHYVTDFSNASRTMLFNINTLDWDEELFEIFGIPFKARPKLVDTIGYIGQAHLTSGDISIFSIIGDQQSALFGQGCFARGDVKVTYGTGAFLLFNIGDVPKISDNNMLTSVAWTHGGNVTYCLEGSIYNAGSAVQWVRDNMNFIPTAAASEAAAMGMEDNGGIYFVPAFAGLGAPHWDNNAVGLISGLNRSTTKEQIVRAALEAMAYGVRDIIDSVKDLFKPQCISVDGGACANDFLMQFQADILDMIVARPKILETTALGAIYTAGVGCGLFSDMSLQCGEKRVFTPKMSESMRKNLYNGWKQAVARSRYNRVR